MENAVEVKQDSRNQAMLIWLLTLFFGFIPGLIFMLVKKDDAYVLEQAKEALNWSITAIIGYIAGMILSLVVIGIFVLIAVGIAQLVFCIMGAVATSKGQSFRTRFTIRLVK